jgi:predicted DsbA family dithiol-disulfide isomerase
LFAAHFVLGEDLADPVVIDRHANQSGVDLTALHAALDDETAAAAVKESEAIGRKRGVRGTPAWLLNHRLIMGLLSADEFERLARSSVQPQR